MKFIPVFQRNRGARASRMVGAVLLAIAAGCGQNDVQVYKVSRETPQPEAAPQPPQMAQAQIDAPSSAPSLEWKKPSDWEEVPAGQMRLASFRVAGKDGKTADMSIVPLPGVAGGDLLNVNRWRSQVGLPAISAEDLPKMAQAVDIGGQPGKLYEMAGTSPDSGAATRILAAMVRSEGTAWFFKMIGDDQLVSEQKPEFVAFVNSARFTAGEAEMPPSHPPIGAVGQLPQAPAAAQGRPEWQVPAGWTEVPGGQFLIAKFTLTGPNDAQAAVNVSRSAGDGGGVLANVNRWRGQLGLAPAADMESVQQVKSVAVGASQATQVEMFGTDARSGQPARLIAVIVAQGGQTWFYKLMGNDQIVEREKDAFSKFVQDAKYPSGLQPP